MRFTQYCVYRNYFLDCNCGLRNSVRMSNETPVAASPSAASSAATADGSGPAVRSFCRRPTSRPSPTLNISTRPRPIRWGAGPSVNEHRLYGALIDDVTLLRRRGFGVHCEGKQFRVGNRLVDGEGLAAIAARERRLIEK